MNKDLVKSIIGVGLGIAGLIGIILIFYSLYLLNKSDRTSTNLKDVQTYVVVGGILTIIGYIGTRVIPIEK